MGDDEQISQDVTPIEEDLIRYWSSVPLLFAGLDEQIRFLKEREEESIATRLAEFMPYVAGFLAEVLSISCSMYGKKDPLILMASESLFKILETFFVNEQVSIRADLKLGIRLVEKFARKDTQWYSDLNQRGKSPSEWNREISEMQNRLNAPRWVGDTIDEWESEVFESEVTNDGCKIEPSYLFRDIYPNILRVREECHTTVLDVLSKIRVGIGKENGRFSTDPSDIYLPMGSKEFPVFHYVNTYRVWGYLQRMRYPVTYKTIEIDLCIGPAQVAKAKKEMHYMLRDLDSRSGTILKNEYRIKYREEI